MFDTVDVDDVVDQVLVAHPISNKKAQEERDALFGRIFGLMAVVRSGRLVGEGNEESLVTIVKACGELMIAKNYLPPVVAAVLQELCTDLPVQTIVDELASPLQELLDMPAADYTASALQLLLHLEKNQLATQPDTLRSLIPQWEGVQLPLLQPANLLLLTPALAESSATHPQRHPVWDHVLELALDGTTSGSTWLRALWEAVVDNGLLASSHERKYLALDLCEAVLPRVQPQSVPVVLSSTLLACVTNSLSNSSTFLNERAAEFVESITQVAATGHMYSLQLIHYLPCRSLRPWALYTLLSSVNCHNA